MQTITLHAADQADVIEVQFTGPALDATTVIPQVTFIVRPEPNVPLGQFLTLSGNVARYYQPDALRGKYRIQLTGGPPGPSAAPAICSVDGLRLDGEPTQFPTGNGQEGGDFAFTLAVGP